MITANMHILNNVKHYIIQIMPNIL
uniref:Uncharacterized protein n=1 Tax=Anguilla anguilla TaxID=7936 RepID=A0A0E9UUS8_ANGAN